MGLQVVRSPNAHAGSKWELMHESVFGSQSTLSVDLNFMYRVPLWEPERKDSIEIAGKKITGISILTTEELAAGKLSALFSRKASRDLYDAHYLLHKVPLLNKDKLKIAAMIYGIMGLKDFRHTSLNDINFDQDELQRKLIPVLKKNELHLGKGLIDWAEKTTNECRNLIQDIITFTVSEKAFLDDFYDNGKLNLLKIIDDLNLIKNIEQHPLIVWRAHKLSIRVQNLYEGNAIKL